MTARWRNLKGTFADPDKGKNSRASGGIREI